jgi:hypothetical protein
MPVLLRYRPPAAELIMNEAHQPRVDGGESGAWEAGQEIRPVPSAANLIVYRILGSEDAQDVQDVSSRRYSAATNEDLDKPRLALKESPRTRHRPSALNAGRSGRRSEYA